MNLKLWKRGGQKRAICFVVMYLLYLGYPILPVKRWKACCKRSFGQSQSCCTYTKEGLNLQECCVSSSLAIWQNLNRGKKLSQNCLKWDSIGMTILEEVESSPLTKLVLVLGKKSNSFDKKRKYYICWKVYEIWAWYIFAAVNVLLAYFR